MADGTWGRARRYPHPTPFVGQVWYARQNTTLVPQAYNQPPSQAEAAQADNPDTYWVKEYGPGDEIGAVIHWELHNVDQKNGFVAIQVACDHANAIDGKVWVNVWKSKADGDSGLFTAHQRNDDGSVGPPGHGAAMGNNNGNGAKGTHGKGKAKGHRSGGWGNGGGSYGSGGGGGGSWGTNDGYQGGGGGGDSAGAWGSSGGHNGGDASAASA